MTKHRRDERRQRHAVGEGQIRWSATLRAIVVSGGIALLVIVALLPSESAISGGTYAPLAAGWCLLLVVWAASICLDERPAIRIGWTEVIGVALVGWHSLAALVSLGQTNGRQALNAHWLILGYGLTAFLLRQTVRSAREARSVVAAMIWLATLLASLGLYQYFYSAPLRRLEYERNPEKVLAENQITAEIGSPERQHFKDRVFSVEPLATFGLTNSLAGVLAPWLLAVVAIIYANLWNREQWPASLALVIASIVLAACLVLTKSRTAYLALFAGIALLGLFGGAGGRWRIHWQVPAGLAGIAVVLGLVAVYFGGLDMQVLSEAPKSVLYRLEYWRATAQVIAQYPIFGCGPGNFQEVYAAYKLPQASEMPADPHNFLLELWATAGTPAVALFVALLVGFAADIAATQRKGEPAPQPVEDDAVAAPEWLVLGGAVAGLLLAAPLASALDFPLDGVGGTLRSLPVVWLLGLPLIVATWWSLQAWLQRGELSLAAVVIPQLVLLINLLAAGAIVFPAVISTLLVLMPLALLVASQQASAPVLTTTTGRSLSLPAELHFSRAGVSLTLLGSLVMTATCFYTEYYPVLNGRRALSEAFYRLQVKDFGDAPAKVIAAAEADALAPEPRRYLAELLLGKWEATESSKDWQTFVDAADAYRRLEPRHHLAWHTRGNWFLTAWKKSKRKEDICEALSAYAVASTRYPNHALYHAQLAWTLHLAGEENLAREEAEKAYQLDQQMPHQELKLARRHITDPDMTQKPQRTFREESAEQTVERLRTGSAEEKP